MPRYSSFQAITHDEVHDLLVALMKDMVKTEKKFGHQLKQVHPGFGLSAANFIHYLVLRSAEIRKAQEYLHHKGLSSLTNCESHTLSQVQNIVRWLNGDSVEKFAKPPCVFETARSLKELHNERLLGEPFTSDGLHIMVTLSSQMIEDRLKIEEMLLAGMTVARINCAHDNAQVWSEMITLLKNAIAKTGRTCKIYMDLSGPKIRIKEIIGKVTKKGVKIRENDELTLVDNKGRIRKTKNKKDGIVLVVEPSAILSTVKPGEHVFFDDGKFEAKVKYCAKNRTGVIVTRISTKKPFLRAQKGINLPDSELTIPALTDGDKAHIPFICQNADLIGYSFVGTQDDVELLRGELSRYADGKIPAIVLKIERLIAVQNLPALLMSGMKDEVFGVMIARGDLAVEIGFERLSEIQQEILWICEAAHVPVIWATQVLETMNKTGFATRSEITDAAMSVMAECVMLNKGEHVTKTIKMLHDILTRHLGHVDKKRYIMRPLGIAKNFINV